MSEPVRILHVFAQMNRGGAETMIMNLYRNIDRTKVQFDFMVHTEETCAYDDEIYKLGGKIFRVPRYTGKNHINYQKQWNKFFLENQNHKIIHGHVRSTASIYLKIAKRNGKITVAHSHNTSSGKGLSSVIKNIMQYQIKDIADYFFACSLSAGKWLFGEKIESNPNFYILNNGIELNTYSYNPEVRRKYRNQYELSGKKVIGHVGRFHIQKNHEFIIEIFKEIHQLDNDSVLLLIGDGDLKEKIQQKVDYYNLTDSVIFMGVRKDIPDMLQAMDIFLMPSFFEGLPLTLMEAQATGLRCVVSNTITQDTKITDLIAFLPLKENASYWAGYINQIRNHTRNSKHEEMKNAGYDAKENARWLTNFYINLPKN